MKKKQKTIRASHRRRGSGHGDPREVRTEKAPDVYRGWCMRHGTITDPLCDGCAERDDDYDRRRRAEKQ